MPVELRLPQNELEPPSSTHGELEPVSADARVPPRSAGSTAWRLGGVLRTLRPHQWVKNVFVLAPVVFAKEIFASQLLMRAASAFAIFCLLAGAVYAMNDVADVAADRVHPVKRYRPIASGRVPLPWAKALSAGLVLLALSWASFVGPWFLLVSATYFGLNLGYSLRLKHVAYIDVACIAAGFVLRVMAGGLATSITVSRYLLLCTALLALFLGFGKRRHELSGARKAKQQRAALESYTRGGLDLALVVTGIATVLTYVSYTLDSRTRAFFHSDHLWLSTGFVLLGVFRFLHIVRTRPRAESPTQEMLRDGPFVAIVLGWGVSVMWMVYQLRPG
jgi:4-hydroxybenzoate polyprenyltransferase